MTSRCAPTPPHVDDALLSMLWLLVRRAGSGAPPLRRARLTAELLVTGGRAVARSMATNCQVTGQLAGRLGLGEAIQRSLQQVFARALGRQGNARRPQG
jgi:hypothetical protein